METGWLYAATSDGIRFSMDCFCLWRATDGVTGKVAAIASQPGGDGEVLAGTAEGRLFSMAVGAASWAVLE